MLSNAYFLAKIGADTAENEQHFAEILPKIGNYPTVGLELGLAWASFAAAGFAFVLTSSYAGPTGAVTWESEVCRRESSVKIKWKILKNQMFV